MGAIEIGMLNKIQQDLKNVGEPSTNLSVLRAQSVSVAGGSTVTLLNVSGRGYLFSVLASASSAAASYFTLTIDIDGVSVSDILVTGVGRESFTNLMTRVEYNGGSAAYYTGLWGKFRFVNNLTISVYNSYSGALTLDLAKATYSLDP